MFVLNVAIKLKDANIESHSNILVFCDQWILMLDLNLSRGEMSDFVSFPLFGFTLAIKLRNFDLNAFCQTVSDLV